MIASSSFTFTSSSSSMDMDIVASVPVVAKPMPDVPENIWLDIFGYLTLEEKFK
ncbi:hypothetical protein BGZ97_001743, partial [Linnemannia gamsii]